MGIGSWRATGKRCIRNGRSLDSELNICSTLGFGKLHVPHYEPAETTVRNLQIQSCRPD